MKHLIRLALVVGASLLAMPAMAQANVATIGTSITVISPITWTGISAINFGTISSPTAGATITLPSNSLTRTVAPAGSAMLVSGGAVAANGAATLHSEGGFLVNLTLGAITQPGSGLLLSNITITGGSFAANLTLGSGTNTTPGGSGSQPTPFAFGGDMFVPAAAAPGTYGLGTFDVVAVYN